MLKHNYGELYLRRLSPQDQADSIFTAMSMAAKEEICLIQGRKRPVVAVRRGFPNEVVAVDYTKTALRRKFHGRPFRDTCRWFRQPLPE